KTDTTITTINAEPAEHAERSHEVTKPRRIFFKIRLRVLRGDVFRLREFRGFCVDRRRRGQNPIAGGFGLRRSSTEQSRTKNARHDDQRRARRAKPRKHEGHEGSSL